MTRERERERETCAGCCLSAEQLVPGATIATIMAIMAIFSVILINILLPPDTVTIFIVVGID